MEQSLTVTIPVGPEEHHRRYLEEAVASALALEGEGINVLLVDDMAGLYELPQWSWALSAEEIPDYRVLSSWGTPHLYLLELPWRTGVPGAFNAAFGIEGLGPWFLMLGADDTLERDAVRMWREALKGWAGRGRSQTGLELTYWGLPVRYMDTGEVQTLHCNAAVAHRRLWRHTGGFRPETASGACDAAFISMALATGAFELLMVGDQPLYNYRRHAETDTAGRGEWQRIIIETRDILSRKFEPTKWGRYS